MTSNWSIGQKVKSIYFPFSLWLYELIFSFKYLCTASASAGDAATSVPLLTTNTNRGHEYKMRKHVFFLWCLCLTFPLNSYSPSMLWIVFCAPDWIQKYSCIWPAAKKWRGTARERWDNGSIQFSTCFSAYKVLHCNSDSAEQRFYLVASPTSSPHKNTRKQGVGTWGDSRVFSHASHWFLQWLTNYYSMRKLPSHCVTNC